jgi:lipopolysaccharide/colanic/teichoic acid biosynthesis glycosyltransferase
MQYAGASEVSSGRGGAHNAPTFDDRTADVPARADGAPTGDRVAAVLLLLALSPVFLALTALVAALIGRPVFYRGERLGRHRAPYMVFKFRTLPTGIQKRLGTSLFSEREEVLPVLARFMRETRLDELPQLINVARGEMRFFGPRPERREIYERYGRGDADYETRFDTAPGLFGVSQLLTPHSAPKRLRARLDRRYLKSGRRLTAPFFVYALARMVWQLAVSAGRYFWQNAVALRMVRGEQEKRSQVRVAPDDATIQLLDPGKARDAATGRILDMNRDYIRARFDRPLSWSFITTHSGRMSVVRGAAARGRTKTARCHAHVERQLTAGDASQPEYLIAYSADSPLNRYLVDQYFLEHAIVPRH